MWVFRELSVQSGVSAEICSKITGLAKTWLGRCISSFKMAYSVLVSATGTPPTVTARAAVSRVSPP